MHPAGPRPLIVFSLFVLAAFAAGCAAPTSSPIAATATPLPSATPSATPTLLPEPATVTATAEPPTAAPTSAAPSADQFKCSVTSQAVKNGRHFAPKERFDMAWNVTNTGTATWDASAVDFTYAGGSKLYQSSSNHLLLNVEPGDTVSLLADMLAPKNPGIYKTFWSLRRGADFFCRVALTIEVP